jgi:hypothetical protein
MIRCNACKNYRLLRNTFAAAAVSLLQISSSFAQTQPAPAALDFDKLATVPGTTVTHSKRGSEDFTELQRGGVSIQVTREGSKMQSLGVDHSGHGAVLCIWQIYIALRAELDTCFAGKYPELRDDLGTSINAMNKFIAQNSLLPTSEKEVESSALAQDIKLRSPAANMSPKRLAEVCQSGDLARMVLEEAKTTHAQRLKQLDDLLSVPRPPVMNPCL